MRFIYGLTCTIYSVTLYYLLHTLSVAEVELYNSISIPYVLTTAVRVINTVAELSLAARITFPRPARHVLIAGQKLAYRVRWNATSSRIPVLRLRPATLHKVC